ncbi:MAG: IS630 family transposase, partial [Planctomycetota bacterium]
DITNKRIRRGAFPSVRHLNDAIDSYIEQHNLEPTPFIWTASAKDILAEVTRARSALRDNGASV